VITKSCAQNFTPTNKKLLGSDAVFCRNQLNAFLRAADDFHKREQKEGADF
jgi:hypothetical protein